MRASITEASAGVPRRSDFCGRLSHAKAQSERRRENQLQFLCKRLGDVCLKSQSMRHKKAQKHVNHLCSVCLFVAFKTSPCGASSCVGARLEPRDESNSRSARRTRRDVVVAISVQVIRSIEKVLHVSLKPPAFSDGKEHGCISACVSG